MRQYYCPGCGSVTQTRIIETVDGGDEYKDVCTCDRCATIFNVFRRKETNDVQGEKD